MSSGKRFLPKKVTASIENSRKKPKILSTERMQDELEKKANFSALNQTNGAIVKVSNQNSSKGEIKKIVIKNLKSKLNVLFSYCLPPPKKKKKKK